jgi:uncharacterized protein (DUF2384 family)
MGKSDRLKRARISAENVYRGPERAARWQNRPNPRLDGRAPVALLDSDDGAQGVEELLGQIDEGFFV